MAQWRTIYTNTYACAQGCRWLGMSSRLALVYSLIYSLSYRTVKVTEKPCLKTQKQKKTETPNKKTKTNPSTNKRKQLTYINNGNKKTLPEILFY